MDEKKILQEVRDNIQLVIQQDTPMGKSLWESLLQAHPADVADFIVELPKESAKTLFLKFPKDFRFLVFRELSGTSQVLYLHNMEESERVEALHDLPGDELTDLFDHFSDEELKKYLNLINKRTREQVLSLLKFDPESAGGIMDTDVITFMQDFTVEKSIAILQRIQPRSEVHQHIFVTNPAHQLVGHINLEDLLMHKPQDRISSFMRKNELVAFATQDQEEVAKRMVHYGLMIVPVVDEKSHFLGIISSETLVDVLVEEASEDVQKMAALPPLKYPYFEMSFWRLFYQRGYVLIALLFAESFSGTILRSYDQWITGILMSFLPMLISAGGNTGSQASAVVIQGMATGELTYSNMFRLLRRELTVSLSLACTLGVISFARAYFVNGSLIECTIISSSLALIVLISAMLGTTIPFALRRLNIDPAFSAGPFLATLMDILGIVIYCYISMVLLSKAW